MILTALIVLAPKLSVDCDLAVKAMTRSSGVAHVELKTTFGEQKENKSIDVSWTSKALEVRIQEPRKGLIDATDRIYFVSSNLMTAKDSKAGEWLDRKIPSAPLYNQLEAVLGQLDDPVKVVLRPIMFKFFVNPWLKVPSFKKVGNRWMSEKAPKATIGFDKQNRLVEFSGGSGDAQFSWKISYLGPRQISRPQTANLIHVSGFADRQIPPAFADQETKHLFDRLYVSERQLDDCVLRVKDQEGTKELLISNTKLGQNGQFGGWTYEKGILRVCNRVTGSYFEGSIKRSLILDYLVACKLNIDPIMRLRVVRSGLFSNAVDSGSKAAKVGSISFGGEPCALVVAESPGTLITFMIRLSDALVVDVQTELRDQGTTIRKTERSIKYLPKDIWVDPSTDGLQKNALPTLRTDEIRKSPGKKRT